MKPRTCIVVWLSFAGAATGVAVAQSLNVNFGPDGHEPPSPEYRAAGQPGVWNQVRGDNGVFVFNLLDTNGVPTAVRLNQVGSFELLSQDDAQTVEDDDRLLDDYRVTYSPTLETCLFFRFMTPGEYEVLVYAWTPGQPDVRSYTSSDEEPGYPHKIVGGDWPGAHREGTTYSRHRAVVTGDLLRIHSGIVPGDPAERGAALNGVQIRQLPPLVRGDLNCDGIVNFDDIDAFILVLTGVEGYAAAHPSCDFLRADTNANGSVNFDDIDSFVCCLVSGSCATCD